MLLGFDIDVEWLRKPLIHPLAQPQRWRAIAVSVDGEIPPNAGIEVAQIADEEIRTFAAYHGQFMLLRPDRYIASVGDPRSIAADMDALWRSFGKNVDELRAASRAG